MYKLLWSICLLMCLLSTGISQTINTEFGKNRVQYHDDFKNWWEYESDNFITYWYGKARLIAQVTIFNAESDHDEIQRVLEHKMNDKIEIIVYIDQTDMKQSNIGAEQSFVSKSGETKIEGNKMFVYYDGDYINLRQQIREGIARVYLNNMLFGSYFQEMMQQSGAQKFPEWYRQGIESYAANDWNIDVENRMRQYWNKSPKNRSFKYIAERDPKLAGHSFWFFIDQIYGRSTIPNLLYLGRISRNINQSFEYTLGTNFTDLIKEWKTFYDQYYNSEAVAFEQKDHGSILSVPSKGQKEISNVAVNPKNNTMIYCINDKGKIVTRIKSFEQDKSEDQKLFTLGYKNFFQSTDYNYPLISWTPDGNHFYIIFEHKDVVKIRKYGQDLNYIEEIVPTDFHRIYSFTCNNNDELFLGATVDGYSDIFRYQFTKRTHQRLTNDYFDDFDLHYTELYNTQGLLFVSNRNTTSTQQLRFDSVRHRNVYDLYFYSIESNEIDKISNINLQHLKQPKRLDNGDISFLSNCTGLTNIWLYNIQRDTIISASNLSNNIIAYDYHTYTNKFIYTIHDQKNIDIRIRPNQEVKRGPSRTNVIKAKPNQSNIFLSPLVNNETKQSTIDISQYKFQSKFEDPSIIEPIITNVKNETFELNISPSYLQPKRVAPYNSSRAIAANKKFSYTKLITRLDNELLFEGLESYTSDRPQLLTTPMGLLIKSKAFDLFDDYKIEVGTRIPTTLNGSEFFITYDDRRKRLDKRIALYRKSVSFMGEDNPTSNVINRSRKNTLLGLYQWKYPFDVYSSFRTTATLRQDNLFQLSTERSSLESSVIREKRLGLKFEYVFDNTYDAHLNIMYGLRYKVFMEYINRFELNLVDGLSFKPSLGFTGIVGFDVRKYIPIIKKSVLAIRGVGATSFGSEKMLYFVGGVENWVSPSYNEKVPVAMDENFSYKVNAFQMRGFDNNIRNGTSFFISNTEIRIPFMLYLLGNFRGSSFWRSLQITTFMDMGMAWYGNGPSDPKNPLNRAIIESPPLLVLDINYSRDPLVFGYGVGMRAQILGYFVKLDYGWGLETKTITPPKFYLSFGHDF